MPVQNIVNEQDDIEHIISKIAPFAEKVQIEDGVYQGQLSQGEPIGYGQLTLPDGTVYQTITQIDEIGLHQLGKVKFADGIIYHGSLRNRIRHGEGQMTLPSGKRIRGTFTDG